MKAFKVWLYLKCLSWIFEFCHFSPILSTQSVIVALDVEWDFFCYFQTPCILYPDCLSRQFFWSSFVSFFIVFCCRCRVLVFFLASPRVGFLRFFRHQKRCDGKVCFKCFSLEEWPLKVTKLSSLTLFWT